MPKDLTDYEIQKQINELMDVVHDKIWLGNLEQDIWGEILKNLGDAQQKVWEIIIRQERKKRHATHQSS